MSGDRLTLTAESHGDNIFCNILDSLKLKKQVVSKHLKFILIGITPPISRWFLG